ESFDPHLDIAIRSGLLTQEQAEAHKAKAEDYSEERQQAKTVNFASTYKVGAKTLARNMKCSQEFAQKLLDGFWERNKAILQVEGSIERKTVRGQLWVKQPVSGFWYSLRAEKDIFSTINQGTAVYVFDTWVKHIMSQGFSVTYQSHDELMII